MTHVTYGAVHCEQMVTEPLDLVSLDAGGTGTHSFGHLFADLPCQSLVHQLTTGLGKHTN